MPLPMGTTSALAPEPPPPHSHSLMPPPRTSPSLWTQPHPWPRGLPPWTQGSSRLDSSLCEAQDNPQTRICLTGHNARVPWAPAEAWGTAPGCPGPPHLHSIGLGAHRGLATASGAQWTLTDPGGGRDTPRCRAGGAQSHQAQRHYPSLTPTPTPGTSWWPKPRLLFGMGRAKDTWQASWRTHLAVIP